MPESGQNRGILATHWGSYRAGTGAAGLTIVPIEGDGEPSPIGAALPGALHHPNRILAPMVRQGWLENGPRFDANRRGSEPFVQVTWDEAERLVAGELDRVRTSYGNQAIYGGSYGWGSAGRFHQASAQLHRLLNLMGGFTRSINSYSTAAMEVILPHVVGSRAADYTRGPAWDDIAQHGQLVVAFGGLSPKNSQVNYGGLGVHGSLEAQRRCREAGVSFVSVSPVREDTAAALDAEWLAPRPNTDTALMLGLAHTLLVDNLYDRDFVERCCVGFDRYRAYLLGEQDGRAKDAEWAAGICGLPADTIRQLARRIAARRTLITVSWSLQRADHGEHVFWAAVVLAAMSGSLGRPGGGFGAGYGAVHNVGFRPVAIPAASVNRGRNQVASFIPVARIADMLLNPGGACAYNGQTLQFPDIRLVYWAGGNPFHHHQDLNRLVRAWQRPETVIVHEHWWNPLARFADIVLPAATMAERNDFAIGLADGWVVANQQAADPPGQVRTDFAILSGVAARLGVAAAFTEGLTADEWVRRLYNETRKRSAERAIDLPDFDTFWRLGRVRVEPDPAAPELPYETLRLAPESRPLDTPSGKIEVWSERIAGFGYDDCPGHPVWQEPAEWIGSAIASRYPLHLISNQPKTRLHSQLDLGVTSQASKIAGREPITMHPADAAARGINAGDVVRVFNDRGACLAGAIVSDGIAPGVVQLATGAWYDPLEPGVPGSLDVAGNPNVLTMDKGTSRLAQGPSAQTALVQIERFVGIAPPVRAYTPPTILQRG